MSTGSSRYDVTPKFISPSDPAAQWTGAMRGPAFFAYANNYLIDVKFGVIMDVEASRAIRQAEVDAAKTTIGRTEERFGIKPERLAGHCLRIGGDAQSCVMAAAMDFAALNVSYDLTNAQLGDGDEERYRNPNPADDPGEAIGGCQEGAVAEENRPCAHCEMTDDE